MPYLALVDQLNRFIRKKSSLLVMCGYSFGDHHLNDTIVNALKANPTAMVLGLMFGRFDSQMDDNTTRERYAKAAAIARRQHNLNLWTFDKAIIGTNIARWACQPGQRDEDADLSEFITTEHVPGDPQTTETLVKMGDFAVFTDFLKRIIGSSKDHRE